MVEGCTFKDTKETQSVIEVSECRDRDAPGLVILRSVAFWNNRLVGASGLRMSASSCSDLEMTDVQISKNECSNDGCGVFLGKRSNLDNCTVSGNKVVESDEQMSSLLFAPASSTTMIQGFAAFENHLAVVRVRDGVLYLSNSSFNQNSLNKEKAEETKTSCIHSVTSSVKISKCSFTANEGYKGSAFRAEKSNTTVFGTVFQNNKGSNDGGCIYAKNSNVSLENTIAIDNMAEKNGGFMYVLDSTAKLKNTAATDSSAELGGFMFAVKSTVELEKTTATNSSAAHGGFMHMDNSHATLENTAATNSSAELGGFIFAVKSTVELEKTTARNSSATFSGGSMLPWKIAVHSYIGGHLIVGFTGKGSSGGFMFAVHSTVKLKKTTAINSSAELGGFIYAEVSTVKLEKTTARNSSAKYGGFMCAEDSTVTLEDTAARNSSALVDGGFICARFLDVKLESISAVNSSALVDGGFIYAVKSTVKLEDTAAMNSSAGSGGSVYVLSSKLRISQSCFSWSKSEVSGGFAVAENSSLVINDSELAQGSSKKGGAIWMKKTNFTAHNLSVNHCQAHNDGGGVMGIASSTFLCSDCTFENNSAKKGDGGAIFFDSNRKQRLSLQLVGSRIESNTANLGGKTCKKEWNAFDIFA